MNFFISPNLMMNTIDSNGYFSPFFSYDKMIVMCVCQCFLFDWPCSYHLFKTKTKKKNCAKCAHSSPVCAHKSQKHKFSRQYDGGDDDGKKINDFFFH